MDVKNVVWRTAVFRRGVCRRVQRKDDMQNHYKEVFKSFSFFKVSVHHLHKPVVYRPLRCLSNTLSLTFLNLGDFRKYLLKRGNPIFWFFIFITGA